MLYFSGHREFRGIQRLKFSRCINPGTQLSPSQVSGSIPSQLEPWSWHSRLVGIENSTFSGVLLLIKSSVGPDPKPSLTFRYSRWESLYSLYAAWEAVCLSQFVLYWWSISLSLRFLPSVHQWLFLQLSNSIVLIITIFPKPLMCLRYCTHQLILSTGIPSQFTENKN